MNLSPALENDKKDSSYCASRSNSSDHASSLDKREITRSGDDAEALNDECLLATPASPSAKRNSNGIKEGNARKTPVVTTPKRGLGGASSSDEDEGEEEEEEEDNGCDNDTIEGSAGNFQIPSYHNSRGFPASQNSANNASSSSQSNHHNAGSSSSSTNANVSADQERQILLLMLLAQVCALHDPTPRTFTVHVLELFERGILGRQSIHFLFELGLVPSTTPRLLPPSTTTAAHKSDDTKEAILDLATVPSSKTPTSPQTLRAQEASAIRSHLEQHDLAQQQQYQLKQGKANSNVGNFTSGGYQNETMIPSPTAAAAAAAAAAANSPAGTSQKSTSWAVEHHPLSLSRYQREFHQVQLLNSGSFGEVFQSTNKIDLKDYAVKRVAFSAWGYSKDSVSQVIREVHCLAQCDHPNVVRYYTSWLEPSWMTGSGATTTMAESTSNEVRRQRKLLTDIQHMMLSGESDSYGVDQSSNDNQNIEEFFYGQTTTIRHRKLSIGSLDSLDSAGSSYDETSSSGSGEDYSSWTIEKTENASHTDVLAGRDDSIFFESHRKEIWESSSSAPRANKRPGPTDKKKQQQSTAQLKYRYQICLFIQMQLCHPATLGDWIRHRNAQCQDPEADRQQQVITATNIFRQIVSGLHHIHKKGIVHRDLKPANLFRSLEDDGVFLIGDFGLSKLIHSATHQSKQQTTVPPAQLDGENALVYDPSGDYAACTTTTWQDPLTEGVGTASYAAPEQVTTKTYGKRADIFSLGLILLEMLCSFTTEHERLQTFNDCRHRRHIPSWIAREYPTAAKTILACTNPNASKRPSAEELLKVDLLSDPLSITSNNCIGAPKTEGNSSTSYDQMEALTRELDKKNKKILDYEQKLEDKDCTIAELQHELQRLRVRLSKSTESSEMSREGCSPSRRISSPVKTSELAVEEMDSSSSSSSSENVE